MPSEGLGCACLVLVLVCGESLMHSAAPLKRLTASGRLGHRRCNPSVGAGERSRWRRRRQQTLSSIRAVSSKGYNSKASPTSLRYECVHLSLTPSRDFRFLFVLFIQSL
eukprot:1480347-Rhodomonas_salina.7